MGSDAQQDRSKTFVERLRAETENFEEACDFTLTEVIETYIDYGCPRPASKTTGPAQIEAYKDFEIEAGWSIIEQFGEIVSGTLTEGSISAEQVAELKQFLSYVPDGAALSIDIRGRDFTLCADGGRGEGGPASVHRIAPPLS